jgi:excinuclease ABC subunit C
LPPTESPWREQASRLPEAPGVYQFLDRDGQVLYVGKAASLRDRMRSYLAPVKDPARKEWRIQELTHQLKFIVTSNEVEALITEATLVKTLQPPLNSKLKDDKKYPYLRITTSEEFPRLQLVRTFQDDQDKYFGPFTNTRALRQTIRTLKEVFGLPACKISFDRKKPQLPCLEFRIHRCLAPCMGKADSAEYRQVVKEVILYLEGKGEALLEYLANRMKEEAYRLNYESAAHVRDRIYALRKILEQQVVLTEAPIDRDLMALAGELGESCLAIAKLRKGKLIGVEHFFLSEGLEDTTEELIRVGLLQYYQRTADIPPEIVVDIRLSDRETLEQWLRQVRGRKVRITKARGECRKQWQIADANAREQLQAYLKERRASYSQLELLQRTQQEFGLSKLPVTIEGYDISNLGPHQAVGAKVVFRNGTPWKNGYRHFRIGKPGPDDYAMIKEILARRFSGSESLPDLVVIDGGIGHLHAAIEVIRPIDPTMDALSLAKGEELVFSPQFPAPLRLARNSPALQLIQRVRDEAHRFAVSFHRSLRGKETRRSQLDGIPGIGKSKKQILLREFGSANALKRASLLRIARTPGVGEKLAQKIYNYLHEKADNKVSGGTGA